MKNQRSRGGIDSASWTQISNSAKGVPSRAVAPYQAYSVVGRGKRSLLKADRIIVALPQGNIEIDLRANPVVAGQLAVRVVPRGRGVLVLGHGDASSIHVRVEALGNKRKRFLSP